MQSADSVATAPADEAESAAQAANEQSIELMARAEAYTIATADEYQASGELLRDIKTRQKAVAGTRTAITKPMDAAKKHVMDLFKPISDRLTAAEDTLKDVMLTFTEAEGRRRRAEQAIRDEIAEVERKRLEARAEKARDDGNAEKAAVLEETATQVAAPVEAPTKAEGVHTVTTWHAEVTDMMALVKAVVENNVGVGCLQPDMKILNEVARELKGEMAIPGVRAVSETAVAARGR